MAGPGDALSEEEVAGVYEWLDSLPLTRTKRNIYRDFSDAFTAAEIVHHYLPRLVDMHNYPPANAAKQKISNWNTLNNKVLRRLGYALRESTIAALVAGKPGEIERVLLQIRAKIDHYKAMYPNSLGSRLASAYPSHTVTRSQSRAGSVSDLGDVGSGSLDRIPRQVSSLGRPYGGGTRMPMTVPPIQAAPSYASPLPPSMATPSQPPTWPKSLHEQPPPPMMRHDAYAEHALPGAPIARGTYRDEPSMSMPSRPPPPLNAPGPTGHANMYVTLRGPPASTYNSHAGPRHVGPSGSLGNHGPPPQPPPAYPLPTTIQDAANMNHLLSMRDQHIQRLEEQLQWYRQQYGPMPPSIASGAGTHVNMSPHSMELPALNPYTHALAPPKPPTANPSLKQRATAAAPTAHPSAPMPQRNEERSRFFSRSQRPLQSTR